MHDAPPDARPDAAPDAFVARDAPPPPPPPVSFVQEASAATAGMSVAVQIGTATAGDLNVLAVSWPSTSVTISSVADTDNNPYTLVDTLTTESGGTLAVYLAPNVKQGTAADTVTVRFGGNTAPLAVVGTYRGLSATPLDVTAFGHASSGTALDSGAVTTTHAHDLLLGIGAATRNLSAGTSYTARTTNLVDIVEDREVMATGSYHATATASFGTPWILRVLALRALD